MTWTAMQGKDRCRSGRTHDCRLCTRSMAPAGQARDHGGHGQESDQPSQVCNRSVVRPVPENFAPTQNSNCHDNEKFQASAIRGLFLSVIHRQKANHSTFYCSPLPASQYSNLHLSGDTVELKCRKRPVARGQSTDIAHGADNPRIRSIVFEFD